MPSSFSNPIVVYIGVWALTLTLYALDLTSQLVTPPFLGIVMVGCSFLTITIAYFFSHLLYAKDTQEKSTFDVYHIRKFGKILFGIWLVGSIIDTLYSGGVPLIWKISGIESKNYTNFGIPSVHGIINACYLQCISIYFLCWSIEKKRRDIVIVAILLLWTLVMFGRGILLSALMQMTVIYLMRNRISAMTFVRALIFAISIVVLFGIIGDLRGTANPFSYLINENARDIFDTLPSGFLWTYVYMTAGINNIFANIDLIAPSWSGMYTLSNMVPSIIKHFLELDARNDLLQFVDRNLNTSTIYAGFVSDFGAIGGIALVYAVQQIATNVYFKAKRGNASDILAYSVMFQILAFSIFYDMFFLLPTLMQLLLTKIMAGYLYSHKQTPSRKISTHLHQ